MKTSSDILIIGSGICGCATARALSRFNSSIIVIDKGNDIAEGATKANSGIIHAGYDAVPGTKKADYNVRGAKIYPDLCKELSVPYRQCGAVVIAFDEAQKQVLAELEQRGIQNGVSGLEILSREALLQLEPNLNPDVICGLSVPTSAIISPYEMAFALADDAALNDVLFYFDEEVLSVEKNRESFTVRTKKNTFSCKVLVNCAGSSGAFIHNQLSAVQLSMTHRRGQYYLLDRAAQQPFSRTIFQCPSTMGKGVLVTPTVHGNLILGPNAEDIEDPDDTATTATGLSEVLQKAKKSWPQLSIRTNITNFSGIRAHLSSDDFIVGPDESCKGYFEAIGIESPGLSSAPAIAEDLSGMISDWLKLEKKKKLIPYTAPSRPFNEMNSDERSAAIQKNPQHGNIVCRCETVTEAEIRDAIRRPVGARTIDGVKRRTRAGMGRCQGGFCLPRVAAIISEETGIPLTEITKNGPDSPLLFGTIDSFLKGEMCHE